LAQPEDHGARRGRGGQGGGGGGLVLSGWDRESRPLAELPMAW
jgi:hypothetical protein